MYSPAGNYTTISFSFVLCYIVQLVFLAGSVKLLY